MASAAIKLDGRYDYVLCDTCVGGSTVVRALGRHTRGARAFFLADYGLNPLGTRSAREIALALRRWFQLAAARSDHLVVACNTASVRLSTLPDPQRSQLTGPPRVTSMLECLDSMIAEQHHRIQDARVCLLGTRFTIAEPAYRDRVLRAGAAEVTGVVATHTEHAVSRFTYMQPDSRRLIAREIGGGVRNCDVVVLACTCFPLVTDLIQELNPSCAVLDPATGLPGAIGAGPFTRAGPNRVTVAVSGGAHRVASILAHAPELLVGWTIDDIIAFEPAVPFSAVRPRRADSSIGHTDG